jgi:hypothetical protein
VVVVAAAVLQLQGPSDTEVDRAIAFADAEPGTQTCRTSAPWRLCFYDAYDGWAGDHLDELEATARGVPVDDGATLLVVQRPPRLPVGDYPDETALAVNGRLVTPQGSDTVEADMIGLASASSRFDVRAAAGMWLVGLPAQPAPPTRVMDIPDLTLQGGTAPLTYCSAPGQARTAIGLFLAIRSDDRSAADLADLAELAAQPRGGASYRITAGGVVVEPRAARLAVAMADRLDDGSLPASIVDDWGRVRSGALSLRALAEAADVTFDPGPAAPDSLVIAGEPAPACT